jgi:fumarylacetoacetase
MLNSNNPDLKSWVPIPDNSDFPIQNLPFGVYKMEKKSSRVGVAIGDSVLDLSRLFKKGLLKDCGLPKKNVFNKNSLIPFLKTGKEVTRNVRERISELLREENAELRDNEILVSKSIIPMEFVRMKLPLKPKNYTDFYSSIEHATNVGTMFRDPDNALLPNWKHLPVGYHGRTSSILPSGTAIHRPKGQSKPPDADKPGFGPSKRLDFELEMAFITCGKTNPGESIDIKDTEDHIFGLVLFNDWSARDIQAWEYVPLGPFLGKNFASSVSPWVVTMDALEPFRVSSPEQDPTRGILI